jgi:hypothetical protein
MTCGGGRSFDTIFRTGFTARRETDFRGRAARRVERRDVRGAVIRVLSIPRRAGCIFAASPKIGFALDPAKSDQESPNSLPAQHL